MRIRSRIKKGCQATDGRRWLEGRIAGSARGTFNWEIESGKEDGLLYWGGEQEGREELVECTTVLVIPAAMRTRLIDRL